MKAFDEMTAKFDRYTEPSEQFGEEPVEDDSVLSQGGFPDPMADGLGSTFGIESDDTGGGMTAGGPEMMAGGEMMGQEDPDAMRDMLLRRIDDENQRSQQYQAGVVEQNAGLRSQAAKRRGGGAA